MKRSRRSRRRGLGRVWAAALLIASGCGDAAGPGDDPGDDLTDGALATFEVSGERFRVWVTNDETIEEILDLRDGTSTASIPNGALRPGSGADEHNDPWSWHLDPEDIHMADATIEVCDGRPSLVEAMLDAYLAVGRFCPWGATLVSVDDRR